MRIENITFSNGTLNPIFNRDVFRYKIDFNSAIFTINITTSDDAYIYIKYNGETQDYLIDNADHSLEVQYMVVQDGYTDLVITCQGLRPPAVGIAQYVIQTFYTLQSTLYPILQHYLDPGFYGGTYIPTYRKLWDFYSVGNDPNWYADEDYKIKSYHNENVMRNIERTLSDAASSGQSDAIVEMFAHYSGFVNTVWPDSGSSTEAYDYRWFLPIIRVGVNRPSVLQGNYTPKNNKLFCFPFSSLEINGYGQNQELKYEDFDNKTETIKKFGIVSKFIPGATIMVYPFDYDGVEDAFDYGVCGNELQVFPYTTDKYLSDYNAARNTRTQNMAAMLQSEGYKMATSWMGNASSYSRLNYTPGTKSSTTLTPNGNLVDNSNGFELNTPSEMLTFNEGTKGKITGNSLGLRLNGVSAMSNTLRQVGQSALTIHQGYAALAAELADVQNRPAVVSNQNAAPSIPMAIKEGACPYVICKSIRKEIAQRIDTFFTRFGYRTNRMGKPNIYKRPYFTFLKCDNAVINGNIPAEDKQELKAIFEKGVTFWHTSQQGFTSVGDYDHLGDLNVAAIR